MPNILLAGDSFAADWSVLHTGCAGWPNVLAERYHVINLAQAGVSEYKIWRQIERADLSHISHIIIAHTSPNRLPVERHPFHHDDPLHSSCDIIYQDIKSRTDPDLRCLIEYFEKWFDVDYARFVHQLIIDKQISYLLGKGSISVLHLDFFDLAIDTHKHPCMNLNQIFLDHRGIINHLNDDGHHKVIELITQWIDNTKPYGSLVLA